MFYFSEDEVVLYTSIIRMCKYSAKKYRYIKKNSLICIIKVYIHFMYPYICLNLKYIIDDKTLKNYGIFS